MNPTVALIEKYFPELTDSQKAHFERLGSLYQDWNQKINVVSRKDVDLLYERHVLHSLAIAKVMGFKPMAEVMDLGTGGGFPGIPLAILFPETRFLMVDSIGKKVKVVEEVIEGLGLKNARALHERSENVDQYFDFVVTRAVAPLETLVYWTRDKFAQMYNHPLKNGIISLKGGDLAEEIKACRKPCKVWEISDFFEESFFETKKVVYTQMIK
ncbi:16S rRNA (guanine(527)-N(7))-methyltransferase RsmG [Eisenibacter elegans]|jgi:16S rRNA (guanine527-N7)-methyltransferase|uniref:16S rRNA (guanine(527)-N(7))-methyltransferase RsmG n=1 Tax=Eisenibacter elegans TaxID=997 RepID=UPI0003F98019|nr:16S rRNA (guanine(527)-N(7))-methyltransferase RsmG [Eisenibacter elegans]